MVLCRQAAVAVGVGRHLPALGHPRLGPAGLGVSRCCCRVGGGPLALPAAAWARTVGWGVVFCGHTVAGVRLRRLRLYEICLCRRPLSVPRWHWGYGRGYRCGCLWRASPVRLVAKGGAGCCGGGCRCTGAADLATGEHLERRRNPQSPHCRAQPAGTECPPPLRQGSIQSGPV